MLAGLPNDPSVYDPFMNMSMARRRQSLVLENMVDAHLLPKHKCGIEWAQGNFVFFPLWLTATLGNVVGSIAYTVGHYLGYPITIRYGRFVGLTEARINKAEKKLLSIETVSFFMGSLFPAFGY